MKLGLLSEISIFIGYRLSALWLLEELKWIDRRYKWNGLDILSE